MIRTHLNNTPECDGPAPGAWRRCALLIWNNQIASLAPCPAPGAGPSRRVEAKSAGCVVALLAKGMAIGVLARLAAGAFGLNASHGYY